MRGTHPHKILVLTDTSLAVKGGAERHMEQLFELLDPARFQIHLVQLSRWPAPDRPLPGITMDHLPTGRVLSAHGFGRMFRVYRLIREHRFDCILSFFESSDLIAVLVGRLAGVRALVSSRRDTGFRYSRKLRVAYRLINRPFDRIIAVSEAVRDALMAEGARPDQVEVVYNGVNVAMFADGRRGPVRAGLDIAKDDVLITMVAALSPVKEHMDAIAGVKRLADAGVPVHLALVGDGPLRADLEHRVAEVGLAGRVHFLGTRERDDVRGALAASDIFLLTSSTEGLSNALLEAMAVGLPVVATRVGGTPEVVDEGRTGFLADVGDIDAIAGALTRLAADPKLRAEMGKASRARVEEHFSEAEMIRRYERILEEVLHRGSAASPHPRADAPPPPRAAEQAGK